MARHVKTHATSVPSTRAHDPSGRHGGIALPASDRSASVHPCTNGEAQDDSADCRATPAALFQPVLPGVAGVEHQPCPDTVSGLPGDESIREDEDLELLDISLPELLGLPCAAHPASPASLHLSAGLNEVEV